MSKKLQRMKIESYLITFITREHVYQCLRAMQSFTTAIQYNLEMILAKV
jgi:hypothetical protein